MQIHAVLTQSCPTLCDPVGCSLQGSSVYGIFQARTLEWVVCPPPGDLPNLGIESASLMSPALAGGFFTTTATWEAQDRETELEIVSPAAGLLGHQVVLVFTFEEPQCCSPFTFPSTEHKGLISPCSQQHCLLSVWK